MLISTKKTGKGSTVYEYYNIVVVMGTCYATMAMLTISGHRECTLKMAYYRLSIVNNVYKDFETHFKDDIIMPLHIAL